MHGMRMRRIEVMASEFDNRGWAKVTAGANLNKEMVEVIVPSAHDPRCWLQIIKVDA